MSVNVNAVTKSVARLTMLRFFPTDREARAEIVSLVIHIAGDENRAAWLVDRALQCFDEWPGPKKLRALYCRRFKPADGVESYTSDDERERWESLPEPPTPWLPRIEAPKQKLPPAEPLGQEFDDGFNKLAAKSSMPRSTPLSASERRKKREFDLLLEAVLTPPAQRPPDPPPPPPPTPQVITAADCAEAVRLNHERGLWQRDNSQCSSELIPVRTTCQTK